MVGHWGFPCLAAKECSTTEVLFCLLEGKSPSGARAFSFHIILAKFPSEADGHPTEVILHHPAPAELA